MGMRHVITPWLEKHRLDLFLMVGRPTIHYLVDNCIPLSRWLVVGVGTSAYKIGTKGRRNSIFYLFPSLKVLFSIVMASPSRPPFHPLLPVMKPRVKERWTFIREAWRRARAKHADPSTSHKVPPTSQSPLKPRGGHTPQLEYFPLNIRAHCIQEYQNFIEFEREAINIAVDGFIDGFENCKACLLQMMPYLEIDGFQPRNSDEEAPSNGD